MHVKKVKTLFVLTQLVTNLDLAIQMVIADITIAKLDRIRAQDIQTKDELYVSTNFKSISKNFVIVSALLVLSFVVLTYFNL